MRTDLVEWARNAMLIDGSELASAVDFKILHRVNTIEETVVLSVQLPAEGPLGIVCPYLPAQKEPVELDGIEVQSGNETRRADF